MKITKIINNNVIGSIDDGGREVVVMGKGIGFQRRIGDEVNPERIEKVYHLSNELQGQFEQIVQDISYENLKLATDIIAEAKRFLGKDLEKSIYITLTDHLNMAIQRQKNGNALSNALLWEIKSYYTKEYNAGIRALEIVREQTGIELTEDEAGFLALYFLNAEVDGDLQDSMVMPEMVREILNIVKYTMMMDYERENVYYDRFVTHLKCFVLRAVKHQYFEEEEPIFFDEIRLGFFEEFTCAGKIAEYVEQKTGYHVSNEEIAYLTIHINRVKRRMK